MKCKKCGKESKSWSLITGKLECGHSYLSKKQQQKNKSLLRDLNTTLEKELRD